MKFRDLDIGDTFDFISPDRMMNSFYERCRKVSARKYVWCSPIDGSILGSRVGSIDCVVHNVEPDDGMSRCSLLSTAERQRPLGRNR